MQKLHPFLDDKGILRVGERLENALIKFEAKLPIVLPYRHHVTDLIISQHTDQKTSHLGQEYVLSSLRQLYWKIKGRSAVLDHPKGKMLTTLGARSFSAAAPKLWNGLSMELRQATSLNSFKSRLKTYLSKKYFL